MPPLLVPRLAKYSQVRSWSRNCPHCITIMVMRVEVRFTSRCTVRLTSRADGSGVPAFTERRAVCTPAASATDVSTRASDVSRRGSALAGAGRAAQVAV